MSIQMESKNNKSRKINKNDLVIAGLLISSALIVAALVLYFHYQPMSASPLKVSVPPKAHIASTPAPVAPSPEPTPVTPMATESPQPSPTSPAPANLAQKKEKRLEVLEAAQAKKQKKLQEEKTAQAHCLDQARQAEASAEGDACRKLYDQYVQECSEQECREKQGWSQDMILPPYLSCCEREARKRLGIDFMGPIYPTSTIPTCNLPSDTQSLIQKNYETAKATCMKL
jgi:hypothetical protein